MLVHAQLVGLAWLLAAASLVAEDGAVLGGAAALPIGARMQTEMLDELQPRFTRPRIGIAIKPANASSFTDTSGRGAVPLKRMDLPEGSDPLLAFQHHINLANAKLSRRYGLDEAAGQLPAAEGAALRRRGLQESSPEALQPANDAPSAMVRLSRRDLLFPHGRVGIVVKDPQTPPQSLARRLLGGLLDGLVSGQKRPAAAPAPAPAPLPAVPMLNSTDSMPMAGNDTVSGKVQAPVPSSTSDGYSKLDLAAAISGKLVAATAPVSQGSLDLAIEANDVGYVANILIGSSQTPFRMLIDSGSADTWVASTACTQCGAGHEKLGPQVSTSFERAAGSAFSITYGTGAVKGALGRDNVDIAGMVLRNHTLGLAVQETKDFSDPSVPFDGLMGLAKSELSNSNTPTPIDALFSAGLVTAPVMGYHLGRVADGLNDGEVTFGAVDAQKFLAPLLEIPNVSTKGFWEAAVTAVSFAGKDLGLKGRTAILDTGTSLIVAPQADADAVHAAIPGARADGQGGYTIPCTTSGSLALTFGGQTFGIDPRDMTFLPVDQNNLKGDCVSAISAGVVGDPNEWLVGAAFLKNVYFATNAQDNVIGLAKLAK